MNKTIYALSTPFFKSAIAIVRVSGRNALDSLKLLSKIKKIEPSYFKLCVLYNFDNQIIDKPLVVFFKEGNSYTGENLVEYHIHGSLAVIKELLYMLSKMENHRLAMPGEFTKRALENGNVNLIEAEGIFDLINSETQIQKNQAIKTFTGEIENKYHNVLSIIKDNLALLETTIDFSDQDIPDNLLINIDKNIELLKDELSNQLINYNSVKKLKHGISLTTIGIPNVGKSSLINYLSNSDVSIISEMPGTTRDVVSAYLDILGYPVILNDTAGIRKTNDSIEQVGINKAITKAKQSDLNLIILDASRIEESIKNIESFIVNNCIIIVNKIDLLEKNKMFHVKHLLNQININKNNIIYVSISKKINLDSLSKILHKNFQEITKIQEHPAIVNERHKELLQNVFYNLEQFLSLDDVVLKSHYLRIAMNEIGKILGLNNIEDILDIIFSKFCIGK